jgi:DNA-binding transcriptional regulator GbsR (MarR family)
MTDTAVPPAERLALVLTQAGLQRMTARLLAALLFTDADSLTAAELGDALGASAGSVSTGIRSLIHTGLVERVPAPGSRRERFRLRDDAWAALYASQNRVLRELRESAEAGIAEAAPDSPAKRRLADMRDFYAHLQAALPGLLSQWNR